MPVNFKDKLQRILLLRRAVSLVWKSAPGWTAAGIVLMPVQALIPLASLYLTKLMVDAVTLSLQTPGHNFNHALWLIAALGGVTLTGSICSSLSAVAGEAQGLSVTDHLLSLIHVKSVEVDLAYYENPKYFDTLHRAQEEAPHRPTSIVKGMAQVGQSGLTLIAIAGLLISLHWVFAVLFLFAAVPGLLVRLRFSRKLYAWQQRRTSTERQAWYLQLLLVGATYAKDVRLFDLGQLFVRSFRDLRRILRIEWIQLAVRRAFNKTFTQTTGTAALYGALAYIAYQAAQGALTLGDLIMYYQAFQQGQGSIRELLSSMATLYEDSLFLTNLYEFLDLKPGVAEPRVPRALPRPMERGISFEKVSFQYEGSGRLVLEDITLTVRPGESIALVGKNGAGKTTLVKLLCRLYDPTDGHITLDGIDLREFETRDLRRDISVIFQDLEHYQFTARENIRLGNTALLPEDDMVMKAVRDAGVDTFIGKLPQGLDTQLGKWFAGGQELSIGEWQKIALARAFVRSAQIIVLDEPTSALDAAAEFEVFQKFRQLTSGKTTILISHRFSTLRLADRIYLLSDGRISESGSHDELMSIGGEYARLYEMQAGNYR